MFFFSDPMMGILALVNLLAIIMLFPVDLRVFNDFREPLKQGNDHPVFDPAKFSDLDIGKEANLSLGLPAARTVVARGQGEPQR